MGKYILVLKDARTDVTDPVTGKKKAHEPNVAKHGGTTLHKRDAVRIVKLPTAAAKALRKEENVAYLQRVWTGEPLDDWNEEDSTTSLVTESAPSALETDLSWTTGPYEYDGSGNIKQIGADIYRYDSAGRLIQAVVRTATETYKYDAFGNLTEKSIAGRPGVIGVDSSSNRLTGEAYDAAGNLTSRAAKPSYNYDSFSMVDALTTSANQTRRMIYGPDDERIGVMYDAGLSRWKIRDFSGKVLREYKSDDSARNPVWTWIEDYVHGEGRILGADREAYYGGKRHFHTDHLGTVRMITDQNRLRIGVHDFYPFGVEQTDAVQEHTKFAVFPGDTDFRPDPMKFTGHERDFNGWLNVDNDDYVDYMHARYYDPNMGRFLSVDPGKDWDPKQPQSWNMYAYVRNNPVNSTDPTGQWTVSKGLGANRASGKLVGGTLAVNIDGKGTLSLTLSAAGGGGMFNGGVQAVESYSTAETVHDLVGFSKIAGGSIGNGRLMVGGEVAVSETGKFESISLTAGPGQKEFPVELHGGVQYTHEIASVNVGKLVGTAAGVATKNVREAFVAIVGDLLRQTSDAAAGLPPNATSEPCVKDCRDD